MTHGYDPSQWRFSFEPIPLRLWSAVERKENEVWRRVDNWSATAHFVREIAAQPLGRADG
jgi:hypothetical protein